MNPNSFELLHVNEESSSEVPLSADSPREQEVKYRRTNG